MSSTNAGDRFLFPRWSLAARLTVWNAASAFLLILGATTFLYWALYTNLDREDDRFLAEKVQLLRVWLQSRPHDMTALRREVEGEAASRRYAQIFVRILDEEGRAIIATPGMEQDLPPGLFPPPGHPDAEPDRGVEVEAASGKAYRILSAGAAVGPSAERVWALQVAFDRTYEEELLARYRNNLWIVLAAALVACAVVSYRIARRGLRPLAVIARTASRIRATTLDERIAVADFPAELSVLAGTFNEMLDRLEESFNRLARFSADIAHELRTPVTNLRGEAEVALGQSRSPEEYREVLASCLEECARLARLIDSLLFIARAENAETPLSPEPVDVRRELETVRAFYEASASESGITLEVVAAEGLAAPLDRTLFQRAIGNLVANALAHTPAGGTVTMTARREEGALSVEVADTGCGIAAEHLPHVFDRFYRADPARAGGSGRVGLGLAIVKSIATLHRGTAAITSTAGKGTRVTLTFPLPAAC
jgi:two-component system heavy metal sensor histidine kinase CusS